MLEIQGFKMAIITCIVLFMITTSAAAEESKGNWTVPDHCIVASMQLSLSLPTDVANPNKTIEISIDPSRKNITVGGNCGKNSTKQQIVLSWQDIDEKDKSNKLTEILQ